MITGIISSLHPFKQSIQIALSISLILWSFRTFIFLLFVLIKGAQLRSELMQFKDLSKETRFIVSFDNLVFLMPGATLFMPRENFVGDVYLRLAIGLVCLFLGGVFCLIQGL